jgi:type I restriction enzyme, S subunit
MNKMTVWREADLSDLILSIESGGRPKGGVSEDSGEIPSLGGENIRLSGGVIFESVKKVPKAFFAGMKQGVLQNQDVLINKDGANTGKVGLYNNQFPHASINEHLFLLRGKPDKLEQRFLYYLLLSPYGQQIIRSKISGSAQPGLKRDFIKDFAVNVPSRTREQSTIANVIEAVDQAIQQTEALIAKYQRIKTGLMQDLLTRGIDENGRLRNPSTHQFKRSPLGLIPKEWKVYRLADLTTRIVDGIHHTPKYVEYGIPFVTVKNLTSSSTIDLQDVNYISEEDHKLFWKRTDPQPGDILVTKDGTLGIAKIVPEQFPVFNIFVSVALLRPNFARCTPELIWLFFESGIFEIQLSYLSAGTGLRHIHLEHFREFKVATPPLEEQFKIATMLQTQEEKLKIESSQIHKLKRLKIGLMQDLLTGKVSIAPLMASAHGESSVLENMK